MAAEATSPLERQIDLTFPAAQIDAEVDTRLKRLARTVRLHGFRPGKVPFKIVVQQFGGQVRQEVMADSIRQGFADKVKEQNLRVAGLPNFEPKQGAEDTSKFEFVAKFEVYPEITPGDITNAAIKRPQVTVQDENVDRTIEILRKQRASYDKVERPVAAGDRVEMDYQGSIGGTPFDGGAAQGQWITVGEGRMLKDLEDGLLGIAPGGSKTFAVRFPDDYRSQELAGKTADFSVTIKTVQAPRLPEVNADFAKALGIQDGDLSKMRAEIKANLEREIASRVQSQTKEQVMQTLLDATPVTAPQALVASEIARLTQGAAADLRSRGVEVKDASKLPPELFREQAERRVKLGLIIAEMIRRHSLEAKPEEVRGRIEEHAQTYEQPQELVDWYYTQPERLREVEAVVAEDNVVKYVLGQAKVQDVVTPFDELMGTNR